jgi:hypothetical protein
VARFLDSRRPSGWGPWGRFPVAGRAGPGSRFGDQWLLLTRRRSIMRLNAGQRKTAPGSRVSPAPPFLTSPAPRKPPRKVRLPHLAPRYWLVRQTRRWREMDSNHRYRIRNNPFWLPPFGPAIRLPQQKPALSCRGPMVRIHLPQRVIHEPVGGAAPLSDRN